MDASKLFQRWKRRLAKLHAILPELLRAARTKGTPEQIHQLRVVLRRMRLLVRLGQPALGKPAVAEFIDWSRRVLGSLGRVRDYDVTLEWLEPRADAPIECERQRARRSRLWKSRRAFLILPKHHLLAQLSPGKANHKLKLKFLKTYLQQVDDLCRQVASEAPLYLDFPLVQQHEFRRCIRRWRYWRELALPQRKLSRDPTLPQLIRLQDALGDYQNRVVAERILTHHRHAGQNRKLQEALLKEQSDFLQQVHRPLKSVDKIAAEFHAPGKGTEQAHR